MDPAVKDFAMRLFSETSVPKRPTKSQLEEIGKQISAALQEQFEEQFLTLIHQRLHFVMPDDRVVSFHDKSLHVTVFKQTVGGRPFFEVTKVDSTAMKLREGSLSNLPTNESLHFSCKFIQEISQRPDSDPLTAEDMAAMEWHLNNVDYGVRYEPVKKPQLQRVAGNEDDALSQSSESDWDSSTSSKSVKRKSGKGKHLLSNKRMRDEGTSQRKIHQFFKGSQ